MTRLDKLSRPGRMITAPLDAEPPTVLTVGRTPQGRPVAVPSRGRARVALVGQPETGKTAACRRLVRRWQHFQLGPVAVLTPRAEQYSDLPVEHVLTGARRILSGCQLVIIDEADMLPFAAVLAACHGPHRAVVVAGWGTHVGALRDARTAAALDRVLAVDYHRNPRFLQFPGATPVLLDPISGRDVDPVRRRTHLNGVLIDDDEPDDPAAAPALESSVDPERPPQVEARSA